MSRQDIDFTIDTYAELVSAAAARYCFLRFAESSTEGEVALWRHDIDFSPQRALSLARAEAASGIPATYFVQVSSRYYSIFGPEIAAIQWRIISLGHDIGLHFDAEVCAHQSAPDYDRRIAFEAKMLEEVVETSVAAFTLHNPTTLDGVPLQVVSCRTSEREFLQPGALLVAGQRANEDCLLKDHQGNLPFWH